MIQFVETGKCRKLFPGIASLGILRLDLPDPIAGGNKQYKLRHHLEAFRRSGRKRIVSFGGAYSNHIAALAYAGKVNALPVTGIIRGEELTADANAVLRFAQECGMELRFISREDYHRRYDDTWHNELSQLYDAYVVPEGGSGEEGIRGCMEILGEHTSVYDVILVASGTGATTEGLRRSAMDHQLVTGIDVVDRNSEFACGGYGRNSEELMKFIEEMKCELDLPLDHVYTGKTLMAIRDLSQRGELAEKSVLFVHTGGYAFVSP